MIACKAVRVVVPYDPGFEPDEGPDEAEDNADAGQDGDAVACYGTGAELGGVQEAVDVEVGDGVGEIGEAEIEKEEQNEDWEVEGREGEGPWEEDFEDGEGGV